MNEDGQEPSRTARPLALQFKRLRQLTRRSKRFYMRPKQKHIVFIDDSAEELETFVKLYSGDRFKVTAIQVQKPSESLKQVTERLAGEKPDLFVLDLFYPQADIAPTGLSAEAAQKANHQVESILHSVSALGDYFGDGNKLLKEAHGVVAESQRLLSDFCQELRQSPRGGIKLLEELKRGYPTVPKVFYSRKATIADVKEAMMESGLDVLSKPHPSVENREASKLMEDFARCCAGQPSSWITRWMEKIPPGASDFMAKFLADVVAKQTQLGPR